MWATNCVSCKLRTVFHVNYELCFMWAKNCVSCKLRIVFHVSYELCFMWAKNCVSCKLWTVFHVSYELCFVQFRQMSAFKASIKKFWSQGVTGNLLLKKYFLNSLLFWGVILSQYTKPYSLRRLTSLSLLVELWDFTNFIFRLQRGPGFNSACVKNRWM